MSAASLRPLPLARLVLLGLILTSCALPGVGTPSGPSEPAGTTKGAVVFTPIDGSLELDPAKTEVLVRPANPSAQLDSVTVTPEGGAPLPGTLQNGRLELKGELNTDTNYTITATATVHHQGAADEKQTQSSIFGTASTPKIVATNPPSVAQGQSVVLTLNRAASSISVEGPVQAQLGPDGLTVTVVPQNFEQGQTYDFKMVAKNKGGIAGAPQAATFNTLPPGTASAFPTSGGTNLGVAIPLTLTLSSPPASRETFVSRISVTSTGGMPAATGAGGCAIYAAPAAATGPMPVTATWLSESKLRLVPKTADGYWPAKTTIAMQARIDGLTTTAGNSFAGNVTTSFTTGDKRLVDVDLSSQTLTTCKNGAQDQQFLISSGTPSHATNTGSFYIYSRVADEEMKSPEGPFAPDYYDIKHVPWTQYFDGGAALHGAWWHNNFGHPMSHGCVNIQDPTNNTQWPHAAAQAQYLWNFDTIGDPVIVRGVTPGLAASAQPSD